MSKQSYTPLYCNISRPEGSTEIIQPLEVLFDWVDHPDGLVGEDLQVIQIKKERAPVMLTEAEADELNALTTQNGIYYQLTK